MCSSMAEAWCWSSPPAFCPISPTWRCGECVSCACSALSEPGRTGRPTTTGRKRPRGGQPLFAGRDCLGAQPFRRQPRFVAPRPRSVGNDRLGAGAFSRSRTGNVLCRLQSHDRRNARSPERATKFRRRRAANSAGRDDSLEGIDGTARRLPGPASPSLPSAEYPSHLKPHRRAGASVRAHCDGAGEPRKNSRPRIARIAVARTGQRRQPQPESSILRPVLQFQDSGTRRNGSLDGEFRASHRDVRAHSSVG